MSESVAVRENRNGTVQAKQYYARTISPPVDVFENADEVLVVADVPGVPGHGIDVRVENGTLTLEAKRSSEPETTFARSFRIPPALTVPTSAQRPRMAPCWCACPRSPPSSHEESPFKAPRSPLETQPLVAWTALA